MTYEEFLARLEGVHRTGNQASAICPAHEDNAPSLSVSTGRDGKILLNCHAGCTSREIVEALGLTLEDLFTTEKRESGGLGEIVARYNYLDESGRFLYQKTRWKRQDGKKSFTWSHKDSAGKWQKGRGETAPVLYNLPALSQSPKAYLVEGEKDVETLKAHGLAAASPPDGAASKWLPQYTEALRGKAVVILEDNDAPGRAFARKAAGELQGAAASVKILDLTQEWDNLKEHGDISDVLAMHPGQEKEQLLNLEALEMVTPEYDPEPDPEAAAFYDCFRPLEDFQEEEATWLIPGWMPDGQITLLAADGGIGKTTLWCNIITAISSGKTCLLDPEGHTRKPAREAFLTTEDSVRKKLKRKLRMAGADMKNIITPDFLADKTGLLRNLKFSSQEMERFVRHFKPRLCVFDPVQGFIPPEINMGSRNAMRDCMAPLISLGEECGTTFLIICHTNKRKGAYGRDRIADSADLWDVCRSVMMAGYTEEQGVRYLSNEKNNYEQLQETILFTIDGDGQPHPEGTTWKRDREYMQDATASRTPQNREKCKDAILALLEVNGLKMPSKDLEDKLKETGYSFQTIKRAKSELKESDAIRYLNEGFGDEKKWFVEKTEFSEPESYSLMDPPTV